VLGRRGEEYPACFKKRKAKWIDRILCRNCLLKHVIEGKRKGRIEVIGRRERRCKQLLDDFKEKEDIGNRRRKHKIALCGERFGRGY
jgi:hypothetical protein